MSSSRPDRKSTKRRAAALQNEEWWDTQIRFQERKKF
jgi:hypothetical protein